MREIQITNGRRLKVYDSIKELPITLSKKMGSYLIQDAGIGSTIEDVDQHLGRLIHYLGTGKADEALEEAKNLRYNLFLAVSQLDHKTPALLCLVHSIDGVPVTDYSETNLRAIGELLGDAPGSELEAHFDELKKNLTPSAAIISQAFTAMT